MTADNKVSHRQHYRKCRISNSTISEKIYTHCRVVEELYTPLLIRNSIENLVTILEQECSVHYIAKIELLNLAYLS